MRVIRLLNILLMTFSVPADNFTPPPPLPWNILETPTHTEAVSPQKPVSFHNQSLNGPLPNVDPHARHPSMNIVLMTFSVPADYFTPPPPSPLEYRRNTHKYRGRFPPKKPVAFHNQSLNSPLPSFETHARHRSVEYCTDGLFGSG